MRASIARSFLIAVVIANVLLLGGVARAVCEETPSESTVGALDTSSAIVPGSTLWSTRYQGPGCDHVAHALGVSPDGSKVFVTGRSDGSTSTWDYVTLAYDASTGAKLWVRRYNGPANSVDSANALGVSPDGSEVFVTGQSYGSTSGSDYATVAYDASTGAKLWVRRYPHSGYGASALGVSLDGSEVFVTGRIEGSTFGDYATVAYDASTGVQLWVRRYTGPGNDSANALGVSPDGSEVFVTGRSDGSGSGEFDYATVAYDAATGARLWVRRYAGPGDDSANALGVSPDGSKVFVTGQSERSTSGADYATVAYDASTGAKLWVRRYTRSGFDVANALGVSPDGSEVFVTGQSDGSTSGADYATVAYDASTGAKLWVRRYTRPADEAPFALGVSPDGSAVFVTGYSGSSDGAAYATVAYSTG
jgi:WD40 repeat protein